MMELQEAVSALLCNYQEDRELGETVLRRYIAKQAEETVKGLLGLAEGKAMELALMALHLLRTHIIESESWRTISESTRHSCRSRLLTLTLASPYIQVKRVAVAGFVSALETEGRGEDLAAAIEQLTQDSAKCLSALWLLAESVNCIKDLAWIPVLWTRLMPVLRTLMQAADPCMCLSALHAAAILLTALPSPLDPRIKDTAKSLLSALTLYLKSSPGQEATLSPVLTQLITMTEKHPNVWDSSPELQRVLITLAESRYFADTIRRKAVELLRVWVQGCRPTEGANTVLVKLAFSLIAEGSGDKLTDEETISALGGSLLSHICVQSSDFPTFQVLKQAIEAHFHASDRSLQVAGLTAVTKSLPSMHSHYETHLASLIPAVAFFLSSEFGGVKKAVFETIGAICREFAPLTQIQFTGLVLPVIGTGLVSDERKEAAEALISYMKGLLGLKNVDFIENYVADLLHSLEIALFTQEIQGETLLTAIGITATALQSYFNPYRLHFLSHLHSQLHQLSPSLRLPCLLSISEVLGSSSEGGIQSQAEEILGTALGFRELEGNEEFEEGLEGCFAGFARVLGERFAPYLNSAVGRLLAKVRFEEDHDSPEYLNTYTDQRRNAALQALYALMCAADSHYSPSVQATLSTLIPYCALSPNLTLCKYALKSTSKSLSLYLPAQSREGLLRITLPELLSALKSSSNCPKYTIWVLQALSQSLQSVELPGSIGLPLASECSAALAETLSQAIRLRSAHVHYRTIISGIGPVVTQLLRGFKRQYHGCFKQYFLTFYDYLLLKPHNSIEIVETAKVLYAYVQFTDDLLVVNSRSLALEKFLACAEVAEARKAALQGIALCAERCSQGVFAEYAGQCRKVCEELLDGTEEESYCAVAALGSVLIYHFPGEVEDWLRLLPLESPGVEAQSVHSLFLHVKPLLSRLETETSRVLRELRANPDLVRTEDRQLLFT